MSTSENNPDAELIAACAAFDALEHECDGIAKRYGDDDDAADAACAPLKAQQEPLLELITALHATTPGGHRARARTFLLYDHGELGRHGYTDEVILAALVRDIAAESAPDTRRLVDRADPRALRPGGEGPLDQLQDIVFNMDDAAFEDLLLLARRFRRFD